MHRIRTIRPMVILILVMVVLATGAVSGASAQDGPQPQTTDAFWQASYWNNQSLSGDPVLQRADVSLNFDWGWGSPDGSVQSDHFSARWTRFIQVPYPGNVYRFTTTSDDGIRVYVDDDLIINQWNDHAVQLDQAEVSLTPGHHQITVEYYENTRHAVAKLDWRPSSVVQGWHGEFYANRWLSGTPAMITGDQAIHFDWGYGGPGGNLPANEFSARWTRTLQIDEVSTGPYRFIVTADDGIRLWVNGHLLISEWSDHPAQTYSAEMRLDPGSHELKVEYYENQGLATAKVSWEPMLRDDRWQAEYFDNRTLSGAPLTLRAEANVDFNWGFGSPSSVIPNNNFSARWTRTMTFAPGVYRFIMTGDDGVRLYINGNLFMDAWYEQSERTYVDTIYLNGPASLRMEYFEQSGLAVARLRWERVD